ncbi:hypothetical protein D5085_12320 [Ectothiorhodospiraceae bacterium BW-2]|nr:hypothetical protein D5085_12320 [Ectothiorhodospiraceae bacterium BW-2]
MKGMVFTEFMEMVATTFSEDILDDIIEAAELPHGGSYTAVGTYPYEEMVRLVAALSTRVELPLSELLITFGDYLFERFYQLYPTFFEGVTNAFDFLKGIESYIHVEVRKLYPDAELPTFEHSEPEPNRLELVYRSPRQMGLFAYGLIRGCITHFNEQISIDYDDLSDESGSYIIFTLQHQ